MLFKVKVVSRLGDIQTLCIPFVVIPVNHCMLCAEGRLRDAKEKERLSEVIFGYRRYEKDSFRNHHQSKISFVFFSKKNSNTKYKFIHFSQQLTKKQNDFLYKHLLCYSGRPVSKLSKTCVIDHQTFHQIFAIGIRYVTLTFSIVKFSL